jgi:hypothetical protein
VPRSRYNRIMHREYSAGEMCHEICQFRYRCKFDYHKENDEYRYQEGCHNCEHQLRWFSVVSTLQNCNGLLFIIYQFLCQDSSSQGTWDGQGI